jgi:hypothetical protein
LGNSNLINDASGNLGLGVTPSAWNNTTKALQINGGSIYAGNTFTFVGSNAVYTNSGDQYINTGFATVYGQLSGEHRWYNAPSGTAGNAISFTQAMTLNASGQLGIGTTSPSVKLDVVGSAKISANLSVSGAYEQLNGSIKYIYDSGNVSYYSLQNSSTSLQLKYNGATSLTLNSSGNLGLGVVPNAWSSLWSAQQFGQAGSLFAYKSGSNYTVISNNSYAVGGSFQVGDARYINNGFSTAYAQNNSGEHLWLTAPSGTAGGTITHTQAMTLGTNSGLSIGTTTAAAANGLLVAGAATFSSSVTISGNNDLIFRDSSTYISSPATDTLRIITANTERLRITSGGNVGIGNTSASARLHVTGNILSYTEAANTASLFISANNSYNWQFGIGNNSNFVITEGGGLNAIGTTRLTILSGGSVGIGTTSPSAILHTSVTTNGTSVGALLSNPNQAGTADAVSINFGLGRTADAFLFNIPAVKFGKEQQWTSTGSTVDGYLSFSTMLNETVAERLRITSGGNVGIGRIAPDYLLEVNDSIKSFGSFVSDGNGSVAANFYATGQIVSGASDQPSLYLDTTWNTTGNARGIEFNVNNTSSGGSSKLMNLKVDNATMFNVSKGGAITTAAPTGYAAKPYKLGEVLTNAATADRSIVVEIDGTVYYLLASTTAP